MQVLIECGSDANKLAPDMVSPLLLAAAGGHHEIVRLLLKNGADVDHMDIVSNEWTVFSWGLFLILKCFTLYRKAIPH